MLVSNFDNQLLMTTKIVFKQEHIAPGTIIKVFKVTKDNPEEGRFVTRGIVVTADHIMIKYFYYSKGKGDLTSAYLYASDVYNVNGTDEQWEDKESLYIFTIEG